MKNPCNRILLSIIVPIYNVEKYLKQCIESILVQTYTNIEIILVDDGSPDNCPTICDNYKKIDDRIRVIHKRNGGLVSARKAGLEIASGEFIGFVDGDDWVEAPMFQDMIYYADKFDVDIVASGHKEELGGKVVEILYNNLPCGLYKKDDLKKQLYPRMLYFGKFSQFGVFSYLWNKIFRREVLYKNQMDVDNKIFMAEDAACTYPTILDANSIYISDSTYYRYRQRVDSMVKTRNIDLSELERYNLLYKNLYLNFKKSVFSNILLPQLDLFLLSLLTVRSGLDFNNDGRINELFAFGEIESNSKILICGAGTFGQHLVKRIKGGDDFKLVGWIDNLYLNYKNQGLNVDSILQVNKISFDFILVAFIDEEVSENMKKKLLDYGVESKKILMVSHYFEYQISDLLKRFGIKKMD